MANDYNFIEFPIFNFPMDPLVEWCALQSSLGSAKIKVRSIDEPWLGESNDTNRSELGEFP